jgi:polysaccharide export outer membrane protein
MRSQKGETIFLILLLLFIFLGRAEADNKTAMKSGRTTITEKKDKEIRRYLRQASRNIRRRRYEKARESLEKVLRLDPDNIEARKLLLKVEARDTYDNSVIKHNKVREELVIQRDEKPLDDKIVKKRRREEYVIGKGDLLEISIWDLEDIGKVTIKEVIVHPDGRIVFPFVGALEVSGLTIPRLTAKITEVLSRYIKNPQVAVILKKEKGKRVFIIGEVLKQGFYDVSLGSRLLEVLALSGGPTQRAGLNKVRLIRETKVIPINLDKIIRKGDMRKNVILEEGDVLFVPEKKATIFSINRLITSLTPLVDLYGKGQLIYATSKRLEWAEESQEWAGERHKWAEESQEWAGEEHEWDKERLGWEKRWYERDEESFDWLKQRFEWDKEDRP